MLVLFSCQVVLVCALPNLSVPAVVLAPHLTMGMLSIQYSGIGLNWQTNLACLPADLAVYFFFFVIFDLQDTQLNINSCLT